jgi:hypothetical protein
MARATRAEIAARIEEIVPLLLDGLRLREVRALLGRKTTWGAQISEAQLKRYVAKAGEQIAGSAVIDRPREIAAARLRYERALARAAAAGDVKSCIAANRGLCELFGLNAPTRLEHGGEVDVAQARRQLEEEIAAAIAAAEADAG